eukprot:SAG22_NODE_12820_length_427_cov_0.762918_1_plen_58_part_10
MVRAAGAGRPRAVTIDSARPSHVHDWRAHGPLPGICPHRHPCMACTAPTPAPPERLPG